jgi:hypothetical protein
MVVDTSLPGGIQSLTSSASASDKLYTIVTVFNGDLKVQFFGMYWSQQIEAVNSIAQSLWPGTHHSCEHLSILLFVLQH